MLIVDEIPSHKHSFGAYCLYRVPREKRKKFELLAKMGIWVGFSKTTRNGHVVVPTQSTVHGVLWMSVSG